GLAEGVTHPGGHRHGLGEVRQGGLCVSQRQFRGAEVGRRQRLDGALAQQRQCFLGQGEGLFAPMSAIPPRRLAELSRYGVDGKASLSRDGRPTPLGDAIAHYGRIAKTPHILCLADEPGYRRQIKVQANLQEGRHALARKIFHGRAGQLYQSYQDGMEDQIGALGPVLNALVLFDTRYMDAAVTQLREDGFDVRGEDVARLSPFVRHHINMLGRYSGVEQQPNGQ
ncbi:Tn3 family transposase, partial [Streptosporangium nondiastaticum]